MKTLKQDLSMKICWMAVACVVLAALVLGGFFGGQYIYGDSHVGGFIAGVQTGLFLVVLIVLLREIFRYRKALHNDEALRQLQIEQNDERSRYIRDKIGGIGLNVVIFLVAAGTIVSGFFSHTVFFTLLATLFAIVLVKAVLKGYYLRNS